jgi:serine/threonine protein kinase HipA of HipAB toxin-antitoxin module
MGLLTNLLTFPVRGPLSTVHWLAETLLEQAENELYSPEQIRRALTELELRLDLGEIDEASYEAAEEQLLERLRIARQRITP